jgi:hypothetical protein
LEIPIAANEEDQEAINKQILFAVRMRLQEFSFLMLVSPSANKDKSATTSGGASSGIGMGPPINATQSSVSHVSTSVSHPLTSSSSTSALQTKRKEARRDGDGKHVVMLNGAKKPGRGRSLSGVDVPVEKYAQSGFSFYIYMFFFFFFFLVLVLEFSSHDQDSVGAQGHARRELEQQQLP